MLNGLGERLHLHLHFLLANSSLFSFIVPLPPLAPGPKSTGKASAKQRIPANETGALGRGGPQSYLNTSLHWKHIRLDTHRQARRQANEAGSLYDECAGSNERIREYGCSWLASNSKQSVAAAAASAFGEFKVKTLAF